MLGRHLAALPLPPRVGKMLLYGVLFGCLDPVLTVACCMAYRCVPYPRPTGAYALTGVALEGCCGGHSLRLSKNLVHFRSCYGVQ